ncbi:hypothetical protein FS842_011352 [Serendipita sp. 407]|nr:hypothetical protein FS842_011352 [Serendipita sp. 407]
MAPFVLKFKGNKSFSPLSQISDADTLTRTWKVCTKVAAHLEQGQRLENLSWRLWFLQIALVQSDNAKQKREFKKFSKGMGEKLDKDKGRSITELQAPNFKRTDSTDKVRLKVEEMAHHREAGTSPAHLLGPAASSAREANHMKGMQYTFAVDPRVKPLTTAPATEGGAGGGGNGGGGVGVSGKPAGAGGMMGKMRVKPVMMGPPPVPVRHQQQQSQSQSSQSSAQQQQQQQQRKEEGGKDGGDVTMHGGNMNSMDAAATTGSGSNKGGDHTMMDVSEDHASLYGLSKEDMGLGEMANDAMNGIEDEDGTGHHTPTPHPHRLLPSHHPSALPYPPPPSTGPAAHALSNAFTSNTSSIGSNNSNSGNAGGYGRNAQQQAPNIIRFPTIFTSDFGPTSLLCALPTSGAPSFSFENLMASNNNMYQSFAALVDTGGAPTTTQQSVTTQGIYGPNSPPTSTASLTRSNGGAGGGGAGVFSSGAMSSSTGAGGSTHFSANGATNPYGAGASQQHVYHQQQAAAAANSAFGIGIGMQTAGTGFDFGVPRPTFEFPIEEILKGEGDGGLDEYDASILAGVGVGVGAAGAGAAGHSSTTTATGNGTNTVGTNAGGAGGAGGAGSDADTLITPWDANNVNVNMSLAADAFGMGFGSSLSGMAAAAWGVQPAEIHSPTTTTSGNPLTNANVASVGGMTSPQSPTRRSFHGSNSGSNARGGGGGMTSPNLGYGAQPQQPQQQPQQQQQQQQQGQGQGQLQHQRRTSSASPPSVHLTTSMGAGANAAMVNNNDMYDASGASSGQNVLGGQQAQSPQPMSATTPSALSNSTPGASATPGSTTGTTATSSSLNSSLVGGATSSVLGGSSGGPGSVVSPGSASGGAGSVVPGNVGNTAPGGVKSECANCGATHTPLWRRGLNDELNCNACGLYCKLHKRARPKNLRTSHGDRAGNAWGAKTGEAEVAGEPVQCHNCATMATPLWRKDDEGNTLCNA